MLDPGGGGVVGSEQGWEPDCRVWQFSTCKTSAAEKEQILGAGAQNSCQGQIMSELRDKSNQTCVKNNEN